MAKKLSASEQHDIEVLSDFMGCLTTFQFIFLVPLLMTVPMSYVGELYYIAPLIDYLFLLTRFKSTNIKIGLWWVFITPVYMYKRAKLLNESKIKFNITLAGWCCLFLCVLMGVLRAMI